MYRYRRSYRGPAVAVSTLAPPADIGVAPADTAVAAAGAISTVGAVVPANAIAPANATVPVDATTPIDAIAPGNTTTPINAKATGTVVIPVAPVHTAVAVVTPAPVTADGSSGVTGSACATADSAAAARMPAWRVTRYRRTGAYSSRHGRGC